MGRAKPENSEKLLHERVQGDRFAFGLQLLQCAGISWQLIPSSCTSDL